MEDIYKSINQKQKINYNDKVKRNYNITTSKIETDEGLKKLFKLQYYMLYKLINSNITFMSDQSNVLYYNYCFDENVKIGDFYYNMILTKDEKVFLYNNDTGKIRQIYYSKKLNLKKRKRD